MSKPIRFEQDAVEISNRAHGLRASADSLVEQVFRRDDMTQAMRDEARRMIDQFEREAGEIEAHVAEWRGRQAP